jgi:hypothetical protein
VVAIRIPRTGRVWSSFRTTAMTTRRIVTAVPFDDEESLFSRRYESF